MTLRTSAVLALVAASAAGCTGSTSGPIAATPGAGGAPNSTQRTVSATRARPDVIQHGPLVVYFPTRVNPSTNGMADSAGSVWMTPYGSTDIDVFSMDGSQSLINLYNDHFYPGEIVLGSDGRFYVGESTYGGTSSAGRIAIVTTSQTVTFAQTPSGEYPSSGMTLGPDGNVWFIEPSYVGKITTSGAVTEYAYPSGATANVSEIAPGRDGNLWFTEHRTKGFPILAKIAPSSGAITEYVQPCDSAGNLMLANPDGFLYTFCNGVLTQVSTKPALLKTFSGVSVGTTAFPRFANGGRGQLWYPSRNSVVELQTDSGATLSYALTGGNGGSVIVGPDQNLWTVRNARPRSEDVAVVTLLSLYVAPQNIVFTANGQQKTIQATYGGTAALSATTSNAGVATVVSGPLTQEFTVTAVSPGTATIAVSDTLGNTFDVSVTVN